LDCDSLELAFEDNGTIKIHYTSLKVTDDGMTAELPDQVETILSTHPLLAAPEIATRINNEKLLMDTKEVLFKIRKRNTQPEAKVAHPSISPAKVSEIAIITAKMLVGKVSQKAPTFEASVDLMPPSSQHQSLSLFRLQHWSCNRLASGQARRMTALVFATQTTQTTQPQR